MADADIVRSLIARPGQGQDERTPPELGARHARIDERTPADLLRFARTLGGMVNFHDAATGEPSGDWSGFFPDPGPSLDAWVAAQGGNVPPHLALYLAFLALYQVPQELANRFTGRHLDFFYRDVLRLRPRGPLPDRAHLVLELKKGAEPTLVTPEHRFSAGKDAAGFELVYAPTGETTLNAARVESLRSVYLDGAGTVRFAPIANSADGLGGKLPADEPKWKAFGHAGLPRAEVGFAIASPVLLKWPSSRAGAGR